MTNRRQSQAELLYLLGQLLGPLEALSTASANLSHRRIALAQYSADFHTFLEHFRSFTHPRGHAYEAEYRSGLRELASLSKQGTDFASDTETFRTTVVKTAATLRELICSVPVLLESEVLKARSPFTAYCFIRDLLETTANEVVWIDRYFTSAVFYRYLRQLSPRIATTLITWPESKYKQSDWTDFIEASRLFASERGPDKYTLLAKSDFHDRWLKCDGSLYLLGGSGKDAGTLSDFTVSEMESSAETLARLSAASNGAQELFGVNCPSHP